MTELAVIESLPSETLIEHLEDLLAKAKDGELQGIVYVCSYRLNSVNSGWTALNDNRMRIMGELHQLLHHFASMEVR